MFLALGDRFCAPPAHTRIRTSRNALVAPKDSIALQLLGQRGQQWRVQLVSSPRDSASSLTLGRRNALTAPQGFPVRALVFRLPRALLVPTHSTAIAFNAPLASNVLQQIKTPILVPLVLTAPARERRVFRARLVMCVGSSQLNQLPRRAFVQWVFSAPPVRRRQLAVQQAQWAVLLAVPRWSRHARTVAPVPLVPVAAHKLLAPLEVTAPQGLHSRPHAHLARTVVRRMRRVGLHAFCAQSNSFARSVRQSSIETLALLVISVLQDPEAGSKTVAQWGHSVPK